MMQSSASKAGNRGTGNGPSSCALATGPDARDDSGHAAPCRLKRSANVRRLRRHRYAAC